MILFFHLEKQCWAVWYLTTWQLWNFLACEKSSSFFSTINNQIWGNLKSIKMYFKTNFWLRHVFFLYWLVIFVYIRSASKFTASYFNINQSKKRERSQEPSQKRNQWSTDVENHVLHFMITLCWIIFLSTNMFIWYRKFLGNSYVLELLIWVCLFWV